MDIPPQSRSFFLIGLGGVLVGAALGYMVRGDAPAVRGANPPEEGRKRVAMTAEVSGAAPVRVESKAGEKNAPDGGDGTVDFVAEMRGAMKEVAEWDRLRRLHATIDQLDPADLELAASQVRLLPAGQRYQVSWILGERWAGFDPAAAMAFARKLGRDQGGNGMMTGVFQKWAGVAPDAARAWLEALPLGQERTGFTQTLLSAVAKSDPATALQMALRLNVGSRDGYVIGNIFSQWAADSPAAAATAALGLPMGRTRDGALGSIASTWAYKDPAAALAWVGQLSEPRARRNALSSAASAWAQNDPAAAFAWAQSYTGDAATRRSLIAQTLNAWTGSDPAAAKAQILALPPGAERNEAIASARNLRSGVLRRSMISSTDDSCLK